MNNKVALITGSSRGIGKEIAINLSKEGYSVVINYNSNDGNALETSKFIQLNGGEVLCVKANVGEPSDVEKLKKEVETKFGRLDVLINCAGAIVRPASWSEISNSDILSTVKINLLGPIYTIREFVPLLKISGEGNIINLTSTYSYNGAAAVLAYTAAKAGINSLTKAMALELAQFNIRVNGIAPGNIDTEMTASGGKGLLDWIISTTPLKRLGQPSEIADCVSFLLKSSFITGHIIDIDGGQILTI